MRLLYRPYTGDVGSNVTLSRVRFTGYSLFCDSPFLTRDNYAQTLAELQDAFYYFKNESEDRISDDELVELMRDVFNGRAQGSMEHLIGTSLEELCRWARGGDQWDE